jgi:hypothetical protein
MIPFIKHKMFTSIASPVERRNRLAIPRVPVKSQGNSGGAGGGSKRASILLAIRCPVALLAMAVVLVSLTSCAGTDNTAFLGPAYDGPTAAYGYNQP